MRGQPDLIIANLHKNFRGLAIEFKTPNCRGSVSPDQKSVLELYRANGYKTLVTNDYDECILEIIEYMRGTRIKCDSVLANLRAQTRSETIKDTFIICIT